MENLTLKLAVSVGLCAASALSHGTLQAQSEQVEAQPTLEDLIPPEAVEDPEGWAGAGVDSPGSTESDAAELVPARDRDPASEPPTVDPAPQSEFDLEAALDDLAIPSPQPLEPDPQVEALAEIDAPDLVELPDLLPVEVSDRLVLAFPLDADLFPERDQFIERFQALSTIEALEDGDDTVPQLAARARSDEELLFEVLDAYGYYDAEVVRQLSGGRRDQSRLGSEVDSDPRVRFDILPGPRYRFGAIDLGRLDQLPEPDFGNLRALFAIQAGDPLYSDRILDSASRLRLALGENGYPFAAIDAPALLIDHARLEGDLTLPVSPGGKYLFGTIASEDPDFLSGRHLGRIARFDPGDGYKASLQADLRRAILATGLVSSVSVTPREAVPPSDGEPGEVALDVDFERAPLRTIAGAIGYGTEDGVKVEASWEHRNLFPPEGSLRLRGILGTREQLASVTFKRNNFLNRDQVLTVDTYFSDIETEAVDARTVALRGSFERVSNLLFHKPLAWQVGAEALYSDERNRAIGSVSSPRQEYLIGSLFGSATLDSSDDLLDPTKGFRLTGFLAPEFSRSQDVNSFYLRAQADASYYHSVGSTVLAGRVRAATIQGADLLRIAPSRRLYAGGGGSVRGYGFQGVGPRNDLGEATGGASLVEASIEARIQTGFFDGALELVPFLDAGSVATGSTPDFDQIQYGAGLGIRYKTSFGPIRVDVGTPLNPTEFDSPVVVYVSLGQAF